MASQVSLDGWEEGPNPTINLDGWEEAPATAVKQNPMTAAQQKEYDTILKSPDTTPEALSAWGEKQGFGPSTNAQEVVDYYKKYPDTPAPAYYNQIEPGVGINATDPVDELSGWEEAPPAAAEPSNMNIPGVIGFNEVADYLSEKGGSQDEWTLSDENRQALGADRGGILAPLMDLPANIGSLGVGAMRGLGMGADIATDLLDAPLKMAGVERNVNNILTRPGEAIDELLTNPMMGMETGVPHMGANPIDDLPAIADNIGKQAAFEEAVAAATAAPYKSPRGKNQLKVHTKVLQDEADKISSSWKGGPEYTVVDTVDDIPDQKIKDAIANSAKPKDVEAVITPDGKVHIIAKNIKDPSRIAAIVYHEGLGHHGMSKLFGDKLDATLRAFYDTNPDFAAKTDAWRKRNKGQYGGDTARAADEVLAGISEGGILPPPALMDKIKNTIKNAARKAGMKNVNYSDREIMSILAEAHNRVVNGTPTIADGITRFITAWHGTPADKFDNADEQNPHGKFDDNYMGKGEGAQAFGWGHYVAEDKSIASGRYRDGLVKRKKVATFGDKTFDDWWDESVRAKSVRNPEVSDYPDGRPAGQKRAAALGKPLYIKGEPLLDKSYKSIIKGFLLDDYPEAGLKDLRRDEAFLNSNLADELKHAPPEKVRELQEALTRSSHFLEMIDKAETQLKINKPKGSLFQVYLPDDKHWFSWDNPIEGRAKAAFERLGVSSKRPFGSQGQLDAAKEELRAIANSEERVAKALADKEMQSMGGEFWEKQKEFWERHKERNATDRANTEKRIATLEKFKAEAEKESLTGMQMYYSLADKLGKEAGVGSGHAGQKLASKALAKEGIPGHKFLDGGSRSKGEGSHNYVIYDPDTSGAKIVARFSTRPKEGVNDNPTPPTREEGIKAADKWLAKNPIPDYWADMFYGGLKSKEPPETQQYFDITPEKAIDNLPKFARMYNDVYNKWEKNNNAADYGKAERDSALAAAVDHVLRIRDALHSANVDVYKAIDADERTGARFSTKQPANEAGRPAANDAGRPNEATKKERETIQRELGKRGWSPEHIDEILDEDISHIPKELWGPKSRNWSLAHIEDMVERVNNGEKVTVEEEAAKHDAGVRFSTKKSLTPEKMETKNDVDELIDFAAAKAPRGARVSQKETQKRAEELGLTTNAYLNAADQEGLAAQIHGAHQVLTTAMDEVAGLGERAQTEGLTPALRSEIGQKLATAMAVYAKFDKNTAEIGRALNILKVAARSKDFAKDIAKFSSDGGLAALLGDDEALMRFLKTQQAIKATNGSAAAAKFFKLQSKALPEDYAKTVIFNSMLSSPITWGKNAVGSPLNFTMDLIADTAGAIIGKIPGMAPGASGRELAARLYGPLAAFKNWETYKNVGKALKEGKNTRSKPFYEHRNDIFTGKASQFLKTPSHILAGVDELWANMFHASNVRGLAVSEAIKTGKKGDDLKAEIERLTNNPTDAMLKEADKVTNRQVFRGDPSKMVEWIKDHSTPVVLDQTEIRLVQDPTTGKMVPMGKTVRKADGALGRTGKFAMSLAVPFAPTLEQIGKAIVKNSGPLGLFSKELRADLMTPGPKRNSALGRIAVSSAFMYWIGTKAADGEVSGIGNPDYQQQKEEQATKPPMSIKIGDEWVSYAGLDPIAGMVAAVSTAVERSQAKDEPLPAEIGWAFISGMAESLLKSTYADSVANLINMAGEGVKVARGQETPKTGIENFIGGQVANITNPAFVRWYSQKFLDPKQRDISGDGTLMSGVAGRAMAGVPGVSETLPVKHDVYGREITNARQDKYVEKDPAILELARLSKLLPDKALISEVKRSDLDKMPKPILSKDLQAYQQKSGEYIVETVRNLQDGGGWDKLSDAEKLKLVIKIKKDMRANAREALFPKYYGPEAEEAGVQQEKRDRLPVVDAKEDKGLKAVVATGNPLKVAAHIAKTTSNPLYKELAQKLIRNGMGGATIKGGYTPGAYGELAPPGLSGNKTGEITLSDTAMTGMSSGMTERTAMHEMLHAYIASRYHTLAMYTTNNRQNLKYKEGKGDVAVEEWQNLWRQTSDAMVDKHGDLVETEIWANQVASTPDEMLTRIFTDSQAQQFFKTHDVNLNKIKHDSSAPSLWDKAVKKTMAMVGMKPSEPEDISAFGRIITAGKKVVDEAAKDPADNKYATTLNKAIAEEDD